MESWLPFFVVVTALAVVVQMGILVAMYLEFRRTNQWMSRIASDLQAKVGPILSRLHALLDEANPRISSILADTAELTHLARGQAQKFDRVFTEAAERLRLQLIHVDQILTGTMETLEDFGAKMRRSVWGPVQNAAAFIKGVQTGLEVFRSRSHRHAENPSEQQDESLFI